MKHSWPKKSVLPGKHLRKSSVHPIGPGNPRINCLIGLRFVAKPLIIKLMKQTILLIILIASTFALGCGSSGSSNPVSPVVTPSIVSLSPQSGGPGTIVTIQGSLFGAIQGNSIVSYSGVTVTPNSWSDTMITVTVPQNAQSNGTFQVTVGGLSSPPSIQFTVSNPVISYISPQTGNPGTQVTISGQYFGNQQGTSYVAFNGQQAQVISWNTNSITCLIPSSTGSSGSVAVVVMVDGSRPSNSMSFNLTFPTITGVNPVGDNIGALITISGQGFGQSQSLVNGSVTIGGQSAQILSWNENSIQVRVPVVTSAGVQSLIVTTNGRQVTNSFSVLGPTVTSFSPNPVGKSALLTISGSNFGQSTDNISRSVYVQDSGYIASVNYSDNSLSFIWPVDNTIFGTQTKTVTINIGGLSTTVQITAD